MPIPVDDDLYQKVKEHVMSKYKKSSAYSSGAIVKLYKHEFKNKYGEDASPYLDDKQEKTLRRWFKEKWVNVNPLIGNSPNDYPLYRATKKVNKNTPTLYQDIPKQRLEELSKLKQIYKGKKNLPKF